ncbi:MULTISPECIES: TonB-dependent receptor [unclassified Carboxylicivirga]|uniref:TonB-dependent receptor n=1 Tax=Carboxylicivirga TaxID=1628153 RepID=UPI003D3272B8
MIKIFFILLLPFVFLTAHGQNLRVLDSETHEPLELVTIFSDDQLINTITNTEGACNIYAFQGLEKITFRLMGYQTITLNYQTLKRHKFVIYLTPDALSLDEVIISATRWKQGRRETPAKISVLKPRDVNFLNPQTAADMIEMTGDVYVQKSQMGGGSPMIRGFATNRVLIAVDGVRMNNAIFRSGNIQNIISLDPFSTHRAEVIFGPGSVIYGSDAIGGVMGFYSFDPQLGNNNPQALNTNAVVRYSSANKEKTGHADFNLGFDKWASFTSITYSDFGDLKMGSHGPDEYLRPEYVQRIDHKDIIVSNANPRVQTPSAYHQLNLMQKFKYSPNERWQMNYGFHYSKLSDVPRYDRLIMLNNNDSLKYGDWYYGPQQWIMNNLSVQHTANHPYFNHLQIVVAHQFFEESRHSRKLHQPNITRRTERVNAFNINIDFEKLWKEGHKLFYGVEFIGNKVGSLALKENLSDGTLYDAPSRYPDGSKWLSAALYGSYLRHLSATTNLQAGLRYNYIYLHATFDNEHYNFPFNKAQINTGAHTGSLGLIHNPTNKWQLSTSLSTGFRAPNIDDVGKIFDSEPGAVVVPNPNLKPEYAINGEIGAAVIALEKLKIDMAAYYTHLSNAMVRRDYWFNGQDSILYDGEMSQVQAIQNASHAYVYGVQAGLEYKWIKGLSVTSRFNYQKGKEELENGTYSPLRHAAPWFGSTRLSYQNKKLKMDVYAHYNGEVTADDMPPSEAGKENLYAIDAMGRPYSPAWTTLNFKAQYALGKTIITAGIDNITDQRYRGYSSGITAPGRNYTISLRVAL